MAPKEANGLSTINSAGRILEEAEEEGRIVRDVSFDIRRHVRLEEGRIVGKRCEDISRHLRLEKGRPVRNLSGHLRYGRLDEKTIVQKMSLDFKEDDVVEGLAGVGN